MNNRIIIFGTGKRGLKGQEERFFPSSRIKKRKRVTCRGLRPDLGMEQKQIHKKRGGSELGPAHYQGSYGTGQ